ncbi:MAG: helix-turn-helix domain-containing protein [Methanomassiliicoccaceae archaeon]|nr:helix-turn-helix domain-containing protein [Methanomassiliicoccaceae archaeon]
MSKDIVITNNIRRLRFSSGEMTQLELAERSGSSRSTIVAVEAGKYTPSLELAFRIANVFNVPIGEVFCCETKNDKEEGTMKRTNNVLITVTDRPARKAIIKRGIKAKDYFEYCDEVGCDTWNELQKIEGIFGEPVSMWLPKKHIKQNTSEYVQGVEVAKGYSGAIPDGFDMIELPAAKYLMFQGEPFDEEKYCEAIDTIWNAIERYDPKIIGCQWYNEDPRIQMEPKGARGYIELLAVK